MLAIVPTILSSILTAASSDPRLAIDNCQFGEAYAFTAAKCEIVLSNTGDTPIRIFDIKPSTPEDSVEPVGLMLGPHDQMSLRVLVNVGNAIGNVQHRFSLRTDESGHEQRGFAAYGFAMSVLDQAKPQIDFGVVDLNHELPQKSIELSSHDSANFKISKVVEKPDYLDLRIAPDGHTLTAHVLPSATWGLHIDYVKLGIDAPQQQQAWVLVKADIHGEVIPASNPFDMSLMRFGDNNNFLIRVTSRSGKSFKTGELKLEGVSGEVRILPCQPEADGCRMIDLKVSDQQPPGSIKGKIWLELPDYKQRLPIAVWGLILAKDVKVKSLDGLQNATTDGKSTEVPKYQNGASPDLHQALKNAVQQNNDAPPAGTGPLLKWTVANGTPIYGFQVFRSGSETGPFVLQNAATIRAKADDETSTFYQWRDNSAESGKTYWYYIGIIEIDGTKKQLSGPQKVVAK